MSQLGIPSGVCGARPAALKAFSLAVVEGGGRAGAEPMAVASAPWRGLRASPGRSRVPRMQRLLARRHLVSLSSA